MSKRKSFISPFPGDRRGAVSLTFDDGSSSQLNRAVPMLNDYGLRGTFYLCPGRGGDDWEERLTPWREVAEAGHELGNHTISHRCSRILDAEPTEKVLENCSIAEIEEEIALGAERIRHLAPHQEELSFAYPCDFTHIGEGLTQQSYVPVVAKYHLAARTGRSERANHPATASIYYLASWRTERASGPTLVGLAEACATQRAWGIFAFHGIDQGHLSVNDVDFEELLHHLQLHSDRIWTAPVVEVAHRIVDWRQQQAPD